MTDAKYPIPAQDRESSSQGWGKYEQFTAQATSCVWTYLRKDKESLVRESAGFLEQLEALWGLHDIAATEIWHELNERIELSSDLLKRGIRARKGGPYRSTKLP